MTTIGKSVTVEGRELEKVDRFVYLSCNLREDPYVRREVGARIGKVSAVFTGLKKVCNSVRNTRKTKLQLFKTLVKAVLLYS